MNTKTNEFAEYCCELLSSVGPCVARRMFGGYGISVDGLTLAILADLGQGEQLWLKSDAETISLFEEAGCKRFTYKAKGKVRTMGYYSAPNAALESAIEMAPWARLAFQAAQSAARPTSKPGKKRQLEK